MIRDYKATLMDGVAIASATTPGTIDLYGEAIAVYPDSNLRKKNARGKGTALFIECVIRRTGTGTTAMTGSVAATVYIDDVNGATTAVRVDTVLCTDAEHDGVHFTMEVPQHREGRYLGFSLDDTSFLGGDTNVVDAWVFVA